MFERAILCIADDDYWAKEARGVAGWLEFYVATTWICRWRRLGRLVLAGIDDNPTFHALVWRDNWRAVRDEIAAANAKYYLVDDADLPDEDSGNDGDDDREAVIEDEDGNDDRPGQSRHPPSETRLRRDKARRILDHGTENEWLTQGNTMDAAVVEIAARLAREAGWLVEPWETRRGNPGYWSTNVLGVAGQIAGFVLGPWREYIESRSGRPVKVDGRFFEQ